MRDASPVIIPFHFYYSDLTHDFELLSALCSKTEPVQFGYHVHDMGTHISENDVVYKAYHDHALRSYLVMVDVDERQRTTATITRTK